MKRITTYAILFILVGHSHAQFPTRLYERPGADRGVGITSTTMNDGYVIAGLTTSFNAAGEDIYLVKTGLNGDLIWEKTFGGLRDDNAWSIQSTGNGSYIVAGFSNSYSEGDWDIYLLSIDEDGNEIWSSNLPLPGDQYAWSVLTDLDGNYVIVGQTNNNEEQRETSVCLKINDQGEVIWMYQSESSQMNRAFGLTQAGASYYISGLITSDSSGLDGVITSISSTGTANWTKTYGGHQNDLFHSIHQSPDGNIIASGYAKSYGHSGNNSPWLMKIDPDGEELWNNSFGSFSEERIVGAVVADNGETSMLGYVLRPSHVDLLRVQVDPQGRLLWLKTFGSPQNEEAGQTLLINEAGELVYSGRGYQNDPTNGDLFLMVEELDSDQ